MIELKFTFATIDEAITFLGQRIVPSEAPGKPEPVKPSPKPKPEATAPAAQVATPAASQPTAEAAPTAAPASPAGEPVTYEKSGLAVKINEAVKKDKAAVIALLAEFGAAKGPALKPEQFAAFGEKIDALLLS